MIEWQKSRQMKKSDLAIMMTKMKLRELRIAGAGEYEGLQAV